MRFNLMQRDAHPVRCWFPAGFSTPRLGVLPFHPDDLREMGAGFESPEVWRFSKGIDSPEAAGRWLMGTVGDPFRSAFAVRFRESDKLAGFCVLSRWGETRVEVGGWFAFPFWNRGVGGELLGEMKRRMTDAQRACPLVAEVDPSNGGAVRLLQRAGFVLENGLWVAG